jgi:acyl-[acyl-carrier-protein] desaturase
MIINLLTEDNLPSYHRVISSSFGKNGAWATWMHRWTAEEARHGIALRDYLVVTRGVDPVDLERQRMEHMSVGFEGQTESAIRNIVYVSFQELATRISHRNTGRATNCPLADQLLSRIATDENLHMVFYRNLVTAAFEVQPDHTMQAVRDEVVNFQMPGAGIKDFLRSSATIANAGIYDLRLHHDEVIMPILRFWKVFERTNLGGEGEKARDELAEFMTVLNGKATKFFDMRERRRARAAKAAE